jgi:hypothetical protein
LVRLQVQGLGAIDLGGWAEQTAGLAREGLGRRRRRGLAGILRLRQTAEDQERQADAEGERTPELEPPPPAT